MEGVLGEDESLTGGEGALDESGTVFEDETDLKRITRQHVEELGGTRMVVRRGQSTRSQSTNREGHTLSVEEREIGDVGDCQISAGPPGEADTLIEVKNVFAPTEKVELLGGGCCGSHPLEDGGDLSGVCGLGGSSEGGAQQESGESSESHHASLIGEGRIVSREGERR